MIFSKTLAERYRLLKKENPECILVMQVGAFMQVMDEDARRVSEITGLNLSMAGDVDAPAVVGGFPKTGLDAYIGKLVRAGYSVAIAFQDDRKERYVAEVVRVKGNPAGGRD